MNPTAPAPNPAAGAVAWWRVPMVWLVIAGPTSVVLAGVLTAFIAFSGADRVVSTPSAAQAHSQTELAVVPAQQARNHTAAVPAEQ